jgi:ankyrin repeat protein
MQPTPSGMTSSSLVPYAVPTQSMQACGNALAPMLYSVPANPEQAFFAAARHGDCNLIKRMLATGQANPNAVEPDTGMTALMLAVLRGHDDVVFILTRGVLSAQIDVPDARGNTARSLATAAAYPDVIDILRTRSAGGAGLAASALPTSAPLLLTGSSVGSSTAGTSRTPTSTAPLDGTSASTAWLASTQAAKQPLPATLFDAIDGNDCAALRSLIDQATRQTDAALAEALSMVQTRTLAGTSPRDYTPLMAAAWLGHATLVATLTSAGAKADQANEQGCTALIFAAQNNHRECVLALLQAGAKVDQATRTGMTALMRAAQNGHIEVVCMLLQRRAKVDHVNVAGCTALLLAAKEGHTAVVGALIAAGASVGHVTPNGRTVLMCAAQNGHADIVSALLVGGASVDAARPGGWTALMGAARNGHAGIVKYLLDLDPDARKQVLARNGWNALMFATDSGHADIVEALIRAGDDANPDHDALNERPERQNSPEPRYRKQVP